MEPGRASTTTTMTCLPWLLPGCCCRSFETRSGVTALDFSRYQPNILAVGLYDGTVAVYDAKVGACVRTCVTPCTCTCVFVRAWGCALFALLERQAWHCVLSNSWAVLLARCPLVPNPPTSSLLYSWTPLLTVLPVRHVVTLCTPRRRAAARQPWRRTRTRGGTATRCGRSGGSTAGPSATSRSSRCPPTAASRSGPSPRCGYAVVMGGAAAAALLHC